MPISPISGGNSSAPFPTDWQRVCDQMQRQIAAYLKKGEGGQLSGYLNSMMQFSAGLGDDSPQKVAFNRAMVQLYTDAGGGGNWQKDLANLRSLFPSGVSRQDITAAFKNILGSDMQLEPGQAGGDYASGMQTALHSLLAFASKKDARVLTSPDLQNPLNAFIEDPDEGHRDALTAALQNAMDAL